MVASEGTISEVEYMALENRIRILALPYLKRRYKDMTQVSMPSKFAHNSNSFSKRNQQEI